MDNKRRSASILYARLLPRHTREGRREARSRRKGTDRDDLHDPWDVSRRCRWTNRPMTRSSSYLSSLDNSKRLECDSVRILSEYTLYCRISKLMAPTADRKVRPRDAFCRACFVACHCEIEEEHFWSSKWMRSPHLPSMPIAKQGRTEPNCQRAAILRFCATERPHRYFEMTCFSMSSQAGRHLP